MPRFAGRLVNTRSTKAVLAGVVSLMALLPAAADASMTPADPLADLSAKAIAPWPGHQLADGSFPDYIRAISPTNPDRYGEGMLAAALIRQGVKTRSPAMVDAGLRAVRYALAQRPRPDSPTRRFEDLAMAEAWLAVNRRGLWVKLPSKLAIDWRRDLARVRVRPQSTLWLLPGNQALVEQLTVLELLATGIRSEVKGSVLADPSGSRELALASIRELLTQQGPEAESGSPTGSAVLIGDGPYLPPAYHALTAGLLARLAGFLTSERDVLALVQTRLAQAVNASALGLGPDGDFAYSGRSPQQAWSLAMLIVAARHSMARCGRSCPAPGAAARVESLALERLRLLHYDRRWGLRLVPSQVVGVESVISSFDGYISATAYTGLALLGLTWAGGADPAPRSRWAQPGMVAFGPGRGALGVSSSADSWFAVRSGNLHVDQRLASGAVAAKAKVGAKWVDLVTSPPAGYTSSNSFGPVVRIASVVGAMVDPTVRVEGAGLVLEGRYLDAAAEAVVAESGKVIYQPVRCGLRMIFDPGAGDATGLAFAVPASALATSADGALGWGTARVVAGEGTALEWQPAGPTSAASATSRVLATVPAGSSGPGVVTVQAKGCA